MSQTPRTDAESKRFNTIDSFNDKDTIPADFARQLELELFTANELLNAAGIALQETKTQLQALVKAIKNLRDQKGRHNTGIAYDRLMKILDTYKS